MKKIVNKSVFLLALLSPLTAASKLPTHKKLLDGWTDKDYELAALSDKKYIECSTAYCDEKAVITTKGCLRLSKEYPLVKGLEHGFCMFCLNGNFVISGKGFLKCIHETVTPNKPHVCEISLIQFSEILLNYATLPKNDPFYIAFNKFYNTQEAYNNAVNALHKKTKKAREIMKFEYVCKKCQCFIYERIKGLQNEFKQSKNNDIIFSCGGTYCVGCNSNIVNADLESKSTCTRLSCSTCIKYGVMMKTCTHCTRVLCNGRVIVKGALAGTKDKCGLTCQDAYIKGKHSLPLPLCKCLKASNKIQYINSINNKKKNALTLEEKLCSLQDLVKLKEIVATNNQKINRLKAQTKKNINQAEKISNIAVAFFAAFKLCKALGIPNSSKS